MVSRTINLEDGVETPPGPVNVELGYEVPDEHGEGSVVGVGLHQGPVNLTLRVEGNYHGDPWGN